MKFKLAALFFFIFLGAYALSKAVEKQREKELEAKIKAWEKRRLIMGRYSKGVLLFEDFYKLIWRDDDENVSASLYDVKPEGIVMGQDEIFYIVGPKLPEGGSFTQIKAVDLKQQKLKWKHNFVHEEFTRLDKANGLIYLLGDLSFGFDEVTYVFAFNAETGKVAWKTKVDFLPSGGVYDMVVHKQTVYLIRGRDIEAQKMLYDLVEIDARSGEFQRVSKIGYNFHTGFNMYEGPYFLTKTNPHTLKRELVTPAGNIIIIGKKSPPKNNFGGPSALDTDAILAVNLQTGKVAWEYLLEPPNAITGWQLTNTANNIFFEKLGDKLQGVNLETGTEVFASKDDLTTKMSDKKPDFTGYKEENIDVTQGENRYRIKYKNEDIYVYEKLK